MNSTLDHLIRRFGLELSRGGTEITNINRTRMAQVLEELNFKVGAEVGVAQGHHAQTLCEAIPDLKLYAVDVWAKYKGYREYTDRIDKYFIEAKERLSPYNVEFVQAFSMDAVTRFADNSLDFVYLDGAHDFKNVAMDVCEWSKKVRPGGIVFGHDYKRSKGKYIVDVKDVIPAFCYAKGITPWFVLKNDLKDPKFGPDNPGWLFVRQETDQLWP